MKQNGVLFPSLSVEFFASLTPTRKKQHQGGAENVTTVSANVRSIVGFLSFIFVMIMIYFRWLIQRFLQQAPVTPMTSSNVIPVKTAIQRVPMLYADLYLLH